MRQRIKWLFFWTTLAYWLGGGIGCASGPNGQVEEQNYKMLEEDRSMFDTSPHSMHPIGAAVLACTFAAADQPAIAQDASDDTPVVTITDAEAPAAQPTQAQAQSVAPTTNGLANETEPSLIGLDRSHWPTVTTGPESGVVEHNPVYFHDLATWDANPVSPANGQLPLEAYLEGGSADTLGQSNLVGGVLNVGKLGWDLVTLPVNAVINPPLGTERTPPTDWPQ